MKQTNSRRKFLQTTAAAGVLLAAGNTVFATAAGTAPQNFTFLFQGDSITDGNRTRDNDWNHVMGHGYQFIIASKLWYEHPQKQFHFFNRGVSGNKITDLAIRWDADAIALKPDLLSILVGINDISAAINGAADFSAITYEENYRALLQKTKKELPAVQLVLCEPFVYPGSRVSKQWDAYTTEIKKYQAAVQKLAVEFNAILVAFQPVFDAAIKKTPVEYWVWDGIHPMPAGHELMAREWIKQVSKKVKFIR